MFLVLTLSWVLVFLVLTQSHIEQRYRADLCSAADQRAFTALSAIIILFSLVFFVSHIILSIFNLMLKPAKHFIVQWMIERILRAITYILTIIFVFGFHNDCWCAPPWQWQIGALAVFMAYINFLMHLKVMPLFYIGIYINMLLKIVIDFIKLMFLPIFLIFSFAFPFYMLFVRDAAGEQVSDSL